MKRNALSFLIHFTLLLAGLALALCLTACSEPTAPEPTPTQEPFHTDENTDGVCDGCKETLDYLYDEESRTYTVYTAEGLYVWSNVESGFITASLTLAKDITLPAEMKYDLDGDGVCESNWQPKIFEGTIDGNHHTISNLVIHSSGNEIGFIGSLRVGSIIQNLHLTNVSIEGAANVGGLAGYSPKNTVITGCTASGFITGISSHTGGIVGHLYGGTASGCKNDATVVGDNSTGGICGTLSAGGKIVACYNIGNIKSNGLAYGTMTGGIVAQVDTASVKACYSTGIIQPGAGTNPMMGGIAGYGINGTFIVNFWNTPEAGHPVYGIDAPKTNENAAFVDGSTVTWASAAEQMNSALTQGLHSWKYVVNTGADSAAHPLTLEPVAS